MALIVVVDGAFGGASAAVLKGLCSRKYDMMGDVF